MLSFQSGCIPEAHETYCRNGRHRPKFDALFGRQFFVAMHDFWRHWLPLGPNIRSRCWEPNLVNDVRSHALAQKNWHRNRTSKILHQFLELVSGASARGLSETPGHCCTKIITDFFHFTFNFLLVLQQLLSLLLSVYSYSLYFIMPLLAISREVIVFFVCLSVRAYVVKFFSTVSYKPLVSK